MCRILTDKTLFIIDRVLEVLLLILVFTIPFPTHKQSIETACVILILALLIGRWLWGKGNASKVKGTSIDLQIAVFTFFIFLSVFFSQNPHYSLQDFRQFWIKPLLLFYFVVNIIDTPAKLKRLIGIIFLSALVPITAGIIEFLIKGPGERLESLFPGPNQFGRYLGSIILFMTGILLWTEEKKFKITSGLIIAASVFPLVFTYSRGGWISVFVAVIFLLFLKNKKIASVVLITSILLGSIFICSYSPVPLSKYKTTSEKAEKICRWMFKTKRLYRWKTVIIEIKKRPLKGIGFGPTNFEHFYPQVKRYKKFSDVVHAHNYYLEIAMESGVIALMAFLWLWVTLLKHIWKAFHRSSESFIKACFAGIFGVILARSIHWIVEVPHAQQVILTMWAFIGIAMAIERNILSAEHNKLLPEKINV